MERARQAAAMRHEMDEGRRRDEKNRSSRSDGTHQLVRGPDGRVYRLVPRTKQTRVESMRSNTHIADGFQSSDGSSDDDSLSLAAETRRDCMDWDASLDDLDDEDAGSEPDDHDGHDQSQKLREVVTVEDVPEDEIDDDEFRELRSVWRNRRPSPGLLMEPVELLKDN